MPVSAGPDLLRLLALAYRADQPVLLHGRHGVGKSELLAQTARDLGIRVIVRDLALMEPPDLIGIPEVRDGRTHYAPPEYLPHDGAGLLVFEELNRCPRYMQTPTLQLLTARQLNDYRLPKGWLPVGAVNDARDGYFVDDLDPALQSRFLQVEVVPDPEAWCAWASAHGVHKTVVEFVAGSPEVFHNPDSNPRAWTYASRLLQVWEATDARHDDDLAAGLAGLLDETWAHAFLATYMGNSKPLDATQIVAGYPSWRAGALAWKWTGRLDLLNASWRALRRRLQARKAFDEVLLDQNARTNVETFLADLPADLRREAGEWFDERGLVGLRVP